MKFSLGKKKSSLANQGFCFCVARKQEGRKREMDSHSFYLRLIRLIIGTNLGKNKTKTKNLVLRMFIFSSNLSSLF